MKEQEGRRGIGIRGFLIILLLAVIGTAAALLWLKMDKPQEQKPDPVDTVITRLEKVIDTSELSTFTAVYNGVVAVPDNKDPEQAGYYVSYEAKVYAGLDFTKIAYTPDKERGILQVKLPPIHITKTAVDITTLDYIFIDEKRNTSSVSEEAYKACEQDVQRESEETSEIFRLARLNAENMVKALTKPFIEQPDVDLTLEIVWEGKL